ncbi:MAG: hypothetical protein BWY06_02814 [Candidatus Latescibacteria bacterium ADurb.Bin168]|nr:MAG: hypothetical protein BWY06_02814 [Candidatus Latescibacteria bacterium ADurb.Bin168]
MFNAPFHAEEPRALCCASSDTPVWWTSRTEHPYSYWSPAQASTMIFASCAEFSSPDRNLCKVSTTIRTGFLPMASMWLFTFKYPSGVFRSQPDAEMNRSTSSGFTS